MQKWWIGAATLVQYGWLHAGGSAGGSTLAQLVCSAGPSWPAGQRRAAAREPASENSWRPRGAAVELQSPPNTPHSILTIRRLTRPRYSSSKAPYQARPGRGVGSGSRWVVQLGRFYPRPAEGGRPNATMHHSSPRPGPATTCLPNQPTAEPR